MRGTASYLHHFVGYGGYVRRLRVISVNILNKYMLIYHNAQRYILYSWYIQFISESVVGTLADIYNETLGNIYNINHSKKTGSPEVPCQAARQGER
jgi:uncharacterized membrane-anchored protein